MNRGVQSHSFFAELTSVDTQPLFQESYEKVSEHRLVAFPFSLWSVHIDLVWSIKFKSIHFPFDLIEVVRYILKLSSRGFKLKLDKDGPVNIIKGFGSILKLQKAAKFDL